MKTIVICSSASFYRQAVEVQDILQGRGYKVVIPETAEKMKAENDYDVEHYKTWFDNPDDYDKKAELMRTHFKEIEKADAILVLNYEKNGKPNYIGGNVLMEMSLAFWLNIPIYILNEIPEDSNFVEEIKGFQSTVLRSKIEKFNP